MRRAFTACAVAAVLALSSAGCIESEPELPSAVELTNATGHEITRACTALRRVRWDYWSLDPVAAGGRLMEVAAAIHTDNPGQQATSEFCNTPR